NCGCAKSFTFRQYPLALGKIAAASPDKFASFDICIYDNLVAVTFDVLLHDDRVRPLRDWGAGKDSDRFTRRHTELLVATGRLFTDHAQPLALFTRACDNSVAIHRRIIEGGQRQPRDIIFGCKTT